MFILISLCSMLLIYPVAAGQVVFVGGDVRCLVHKGRSELALMSSPARPCHRQHGAVPASVSRRFFYSSDHRPSDKQIVLAGGGRFIIGRCTNPETIPNEGNGLFDSEVLSKQHAEVWEQGGKASLYFCRFPGLKEFSTFTPPCRYISKTLSR
jgi:hypothetical protein